MESTSVFTVRRAVLPLVVLLALTGTLAASGPAASGSHHDETGSQSDPDERVLVT